MGSQLLMLILNHFFLNVIEVMLEFIVRSMQSSAAWSAKIFQAVIAMNACMDTIRHTQLALQRL